MRNLGAARLLDFNFKLNFLSTWNIVRRWSGMAKGMAVLLGIPQDTCTWRRRKDFPVKNNIYTAVKKLLPQTFASSSESNVYVQTDM